MFKGTKELFDCMDTNKYGALFVAGKSGESNPMTIGWAASGIVWRKPVFIALIRYNRFTHTLLDNKEWAVCLPKDDSYKDELAICGSKSGRDVDKFKECNFKREKAHKINVDIPDMKGVVYECRTIYQDDMDPKLLDEVIENTVYNVDTNHHTIIFGEIIDSYEK